MNKNKLFSKYVFQIGTVLSILVLAAYAMSSSLPAKAFAQEGGPDATSVLEDDRDLVDTEVQTGLNLDVELDVMFDEEDCEEANDDVNQQEEQSVDQDAYVSTAVQTSNNVAITPDFDFANCEPTDQTNQGVRQSTNQGDEGYQTSVQDGRNYANDYNFYANLPL